MKTRIPEDQELHDELEELRTKYMETHNELIVFLTDAENSALEGNYLGIDQNINTALGYHAQSLVYLLNAQHSFKRHVGEWD